MDGHRGRLFVEGNKNGLYAAVGTDSRRVRVTTRDATWSWPLRDVAATRVSSTHYKLALGSEEFVFAPDEPVVFTFEFVDRIGRQPLARRRLRRRPKGHPTQARPQPSRPRRSGADVPQTVGAGVPQSEIWTDLASGRDEASLLETLSELSSTDHDHQWEAQRSGVQVCAECHQVFIDLIAAEEAPEPWSAKE